MSLKEKTFRDGVSQTDRNIAALDINYVSIEERPVEDLLKFVLKFVERLKFYNSANHPEGNWKLFFGGDQIPDHTRDKEGLTDDEKQYLTEMADYLENPGKYADDPHKLTLYSAPHRVLLLVYLKLLEYARQEFTDLTRRHLDYYYRDVLQLTEKPATPDQVNVVFELADGVTEHLLEHSTQLDGGQASSGRPRQYSLDDDIVVNRAQLAGVNTLHVQRKVIDLKSIHNSDTLQDSEVKSDIDFFNMLKWGLGYPSQGDELPLYPNNDAADYDTPVDPGALNTIYHDIKDFDYATGTASHQHEHDYILDQLNFTRLEDFIYVMGLNERQQDENPVNNPGDEEWQQAYDYIKSAFLKRKAKARQGTLKEINENAQNGGFIAMNEYVFGAVETNQLPLFTHAPQADSRRTLDTVNLLLRTSEPDQAEYNDAQAYVNKHLSMSTDDFRYMMDTHNQITDLTDPAWQHVYEIVERAQSAKENYAPSLENIQVQRLVPRVVFARDKIDFPDSFSMFGEASQNLADAGVDTKFHHLGFAVSSPLLVLIEGKRVINLSFTFNNQLNQEMIAAIADGLTVEFTGGVDLLWFSAEREDIRINYSITSNSQTLHLEITLEESAPALLAPVVDTSTFAPVQPVTSTHPVIRLSVKDIIEDSSTHNNLYYTKLKNLQLQKLSLDVSVGDGIGTGIKNLALRNDNNVLNSDSVLVPFGQNPHHLAGFYIANDEISQKRLASITFHLEWINLPESFNSESGHYQGYKDIKGEIIEVADEDFEAELKVFNRRMFGTIESKNLFNLKTPEAAAGSDTVQADSPVQAEAESPDAPDAILNPISSLLYSAASLSDSYTDIDLVNTESNDPFDWDRYFKLELTGKNSTFLQDAYLVALQNLGAGEKINQPYAPQLRQVSADYSCTSTIDFTATDQSRDPIQVLQIHPFGQVDLLKTNSLTDAHGNPKGYHLLPQYSEHGHLYIAIEDLQDKQELSLLFQMDAGSEDSDLEPPEVSWNYLRNDNWIKFNDEELLSDRTNGMLDTGIIRFHPPSSLDATVLRPPATTSNSLMPNGFHWFEARVPDSIYAFPKGIAITPQAVSATQLLQTPASEHLNDTLPANSITKPVTPLSAIDTVKQPYSSFAGNGQEDNAQFIKRASERLRHKDRAVSMWDYERLILEQFPDIYKVKCLNQTAQENDPATAKVKLVVIPNLIDRTPFFPLQPKVSQKLRRQIADYLQDRVSPFVDFEVVNPRYEEIRYRVTLKFKHQESEGFYLRQLNQDIINYLSPWAYSNQADVTFGGAIHRSSLIHFITNLSYVDFIGNVELIDHALIRRDSEGFITKQLLTPLDQDMVKTRFPDSILVSSPNHFIDLVTDEFEALQFSGIGYMVVGVDFIVA